MATKGKGKRPKPRRVRANRRSPPKEVQKAQEQAATETEQPSQAEPAKEPEARPTIRKGIYLSALIYVEGDMPAPDDFIGPATNALKSVLDEALNGQRDRLSMTLKKVEVRNDIEQDAGEEDGQTEEKFQF